MFKGCHLPPSQPPPTNLQIMSDARFDSSQLPSEKKLRLSVVCCTAKAISSQLNSLQWRRPAPTISAPLHPDHFHPKPGLLCTTALSSSNRRSGGWDWKQVPTVACGRLHKTCGRSVTCRDSNQWEARGACWLFESAKSLKMLGRRHEKGLTVVLDFGKGVECLSLDMLFTSQHEQSLGFIVPTFLYEMLSCRGLERAATVLLHVFSRAVHHRELTFWTPEQRHYADSELRAPVA